MPVLDGISAAERIARARLAPVVLLTAFSQTELVERARDAGAMAYVVKPFTASALLPALEIALSRFSEITALEAEVADLSERYETRKQVERAKGLLMSGMGLSEPEAFRWIQKTSMDRRLSMREVADVVITQAGGKPA
jgi:response regulator NasT